jgi:hypothetical protein
MDGAAVAAVVEMAVQVNKAGGNQLSRYIYHISSPCGVNVLGYRSYFSVFERNIPTVMDALGRV